MTFDAVVIGAGPNGLVAANRLADAGWSVLVCEGQEEPGGAVRSARDVHPDFVHDTFSAYYPLAVASPAIRGLRLEEFGLTWCHPPAVIGHPLPDGRWALLHRDREITAALLDEDHPGDGAAWLELVGQWDAIGQTIVDALYSPFPPLQQALGGLRGLPAAGGPGFVRDLLTPAVRLVERRFGGDAARLLILGSAGHADIPLTAPGSGAFGLLMAMLGQTVGWPAPEGGAGALSAALVRRLASRGGELRCSSPVTRIDIEGGRAVGVRLEGGERIAARHVVADVVAPRLYGGLVPVEQLPRRVRWGMRRFAMDPATIKVDWALSGPVPWRVAPTYAPGTFHVADSPAQLAESLAQVAAGVVPAKPFLLAGQMTTADASRSPAGTESLWAYTHVPQGGRWDRSECERYADVVQARLEALAPGFGERVLARRVLGPHDIEARDANLIGGAVGGGAGDLGHQFVLRPVPGLGRAETGIRGLYLASASAHPGGGVHGAAGMNAARAALFHDRIPRR